MFGAKDAVDLGLLFLVDKLKLTLDLLYRCLEAILVQADRAQFQLLSFPVSCDAPRSREQRIARQLLSQRNLDAWYPATFVCNVFVGRRPYLKGRSAFQFQCQFVLTFLQARQV